MLDRMIYLLKFKIIDLWNEVLLQVLNKKKVQQYLREM
ncbi:hypothetical protein P689_122172 [Candidatus Riesia pediculischaeffi PTSU]|uniref:Uncharacterized protein n=1 Tax=Candidatus Riesia pediculischaeffi PTSU TaxID=1401651 RepID=A0A0C1V828_9ENTR|nr:hypothetical protein P689_122172 [Candidatus Riesia pediculischaeffi PTSU]